MRRALFMSAMLASLNRLGLPGSSTLETRWVGGRRGFVHGGF